MAEQQTRHPDKHTHTHTHVQTHTHVHTHTHTHTYTHTDKELTCCTSKSAAPVLGTKLNLEFSSVGLNSIDT